MKRPALLPLLVLFCGQELAAQGVPDAPVPSSTLEQVPEQEFINEEPLIMFLDEEPQFPGGPRALEAYINKELRYPVIAKELAIQGVVHVTFEIGPDGRVDKVNVVHGLGGGCNEEATRLVRSMPEWMPGKKEGKVVPWQCALQIRFRLPPTSHRN